MRAADAGLAEPVLLQEDQSVLRALAILDQITAVVAAALERNEDFKILCKGPGYCWSVIVAALPAQGKLAMERWLTSTDKDVRRIMKGNLKKNRLLKMDEDRVTSWRTKIWEEK